MLYLRRKEPTRNFGCRTSWDGRVGPGVTNTASQLGRFFHKTKPNSEQEQQTVAVVNVHLRLSLSEPSNLLGLVGKRLFREFQPRMLEPSQGQSVWIHPCKPSQFFYCLFSSLNILGTHCIIFRNQIIRRRFLIQAASLSEVGCNCSWELQRNEYGDCLVPFEQQLACGDCTRNYSCFGSDFNAPEISYVG